MRRLALLLSTVFSAGAVAASGCPVPQAQYAYSAGSAVATFVALPHLTGFISKVALHVIIDGKRSYWFLFDGGTSRVVQLISVNDPTLQDWVPPDPDSRRGRPLADQTFLSWNDDMKILSVPPDIGTDAPRYFIIPELPDTLWYNLRDRVSLAPGIFHVARCRR